MDDGTRNLRVVTKGDHTQRRNDTTTRQTDDSEPRATVALLREGAASELVISISGLAARRSKLVGLFLYVSGVELLTMA